MLTFEGRCVKKSINLNINSRTNKTNENLYCFVFCFKTNTGVCDRCICQGLGLQGFDFKNHKYVKPLKR